jgi:hypothetical protein
MDDSLVENGLVRFEVDIDPERPYAWHYEDLNYVWWYACMTTPERLARGIFNLSCCFYSP